MASGAGWEYYADGKSYKSEIEALNNRLKELEEEKTQLKLDLYLCRKAQKSKETK